jgi:DNA-binding NarL/FixJ family response regulator
VTFRVEEAHAVSVLEAAHAGHTSLGTWLDQLVAAMKALTPEATLTVCAVVQRHADHWELVGGDTAAQSIGPLADFGQMLPMVPPAALDAYYRMPQHVDTHARIRVKQPAARDVGDGFLAALGVTDSISLLSQGGDGVSMVLFSMAPYTIEVSPKSRLLLGRTAAHLEAALRTRIDDTEPVAVLGVDGRVHHAEGDAQREHVRERLATHVTSVEKKRLRFQRTRSGAIDGWSALVSGRFGVVERVDGRRREYHVHEHPPHVWSARALSEREASVLELSARGMSGKLVAYSLGISDASVSEALAGAALKAGCGSRAEMVRLAAAVLQPDGLSVDLGGFTPAERDVLARLREGWSNAAIARERGTSERTVANQVGSLLRKSGQGSRRALAAVRPPTPD